MNSKTIVLFGIIAIHVSKPMNSAELQRIQYNNPGLTVDLGVGLWAWPLPMDFDGDGDLDLVVSCPDKPYNGTYFFENTDGRKKLPVFRPGRRISQGQQNVHVTFVDGKPRVLGEGREFHQFAAHGLDESRELSVKSGFHQLIGTRSNKTRGQHWSYCDFEGDGDSDLLIGVGDWSDYGWDDAFDKQGNWTHGPLHGFVYLARNEATESNADNFAAPQKLMAGDQPIDVYGRPTPNYVDFDGDGDSDLLCGEFLDGFTYFENVGTRAEPRFATGRRLMNSDGEPLVMALQMIVPVAIDWDDDGDQDLVVGDEDGRVALVEHTGQYDDGRPIFHKPIYFQQLADEMKCGALSTPVGVDWDNDGDDDLLCGNTAGYIEFIENLGVTGPIDSAMPKWAAPQKLTAGGGTIRIQAESNGSIQGPCEAKWGYTTLTAGDWDHDGLTDIVVNSIWGKIVWYRNVGTRRTPKLSPAQAVTVNWQGEPQKPDWFWWQPADDELVTQWRTTPIVYDWNGDGKNDLVMLDHEGYLTLFPRANDGHDVLVPQRIFCDEKGDAIRLNTDRAGGSGRRKLVITDWDGDGRLDLLVNSKNADWYRQIERPSDTEPTADAAHYYFRNMGPMSSRVISSHTTSPTVVDWNKDGIPDLLLGAEDGYLYFMPNERANQ